ncbi:SDR family NAD(P)-dependent oxidoreductase [uncultured Aeromicrobium sp.]|uniref:SDR family NAD(P)-dependent oxidoreductase n=1 Tax=uncultured Aeromicrobium sp. TaxID=337820 RepID=UPI0025DE7D81|nr:SDR family NAD(P)-dependent oxidoreductase [uncultured Aeromicrobium sp.]
MSRPSDIAADSPGIAVVVGGAGAIGTACVAALVARGFRVVVADLDPERATAAMNRTGAAEAIAVDVRSSASVRSAFDEVADRWGRLDVAVNLAAVGGPARRLHAHSDDEWERVVDVNLNGTFRCLREELRLMAATGGGGSIVVVSSVGAEVGFAGAAPYATTKHALTGLVRSAALEYADDGIRVNAVVPGFVDTAFLRDRRTPAELAQLASAHPVGRLAKAEEVAAVVSFLASSEAGFVTGSCYGVDGGFLAGRSLPLAERIATGAPTS